MIKIYKEEDGYTTDQIAKFTPYSSRQTLLQALHNNQKGRKSGQASGDLLSAIWDTRFKFGKRWLFDREKIDQIVSIYLPS